MRFSVVIPLYNKAEFVQKALESVFVQTFDDFELIVIDDGSRDNSYIIAQEALKHSPVGYLLIHQANAGVSTARNNGVSISQGEFICFLDADDWWEPTFLEEMNSLIRDYPDAGLYGTSYSVIDKGRNKTRLASIGVNNGFERGYIDYFKTYKNSLYMPVWTGATCVPRTVFESVQGFNPVLKMGEDFDLWVRIALNHKVALLNLPLSNYNQDVVLTKRAIGSLPPPETQFAFQADYLYGAKEKDPVLKYVVEMVQIICLKKYYLSKKYHKRAREVLATLDISRHKDKAYAGYLNEPYFWALFKDRMYRYLRNG